MANKNRKNQNDGSANHTTKNTTANEKKSVDTHDTKEQPKNNFDVYALWELVKKYKRYIAAGALFAAMVVILVKCTGPVTDTDTPKKPVDEQTSDANQEEAFQVDAIPEINELISNYYKAYASGDMDALEKVAQPLLDTEKSYIQVFSEYVESYEKLSCYTKSGLNDGEYVVLVYMEMKFKDVATAAPGLDFFYLRTKESGELYIDNAYSRFNQSNMEASTEADVQALINEFEQAEDVAELQDEVQQKYDQAVASDADLSRMANETMPGVIATWMQSLSQGNDADAEPGDQTDGQDKPAEDEEKPDEQTGDDKSDDTSSDDNQEPDDEQESDGKAKTAYAIDGINLRKGPSTDDEILTQISLGEKLKIYPDTKKDGWVKASYDGKNGYVKREYVTTDQSKVPSGTDETADNDPPAALPEGKEIVLSDSVNVRASMSETADRVGLAYQGDVVKVIQSYAEGWTKVEWNGQTGYIKTDLIK